jgi:hypothetical protein
MIQTHGVILVVLFASFIALSIVMFLLWVTKWESKTIGLWGAGAYGGFSGAFGLGVTHHWPLWFYGLLSIIAFVIVQDILMPELEAFVRKQPKKEEDANV